MTVFFKIVFWSSFLALFHTYFLYPLLLKVLAKNKKNNTQFYGLDSLPKVAIVIAAYNEEDVIFNKIESILNLDFPNHQLDIFIGSDKSSDKTVEIIKSFNNERIKLFDFNERQGKSGVLNKLFNEKLNLGKYEVLVLTDANVILERNSVKNLVKHFLNPTIGVVCANIKNKIKKSSEVNEQEAVYIATENEIKINEGIVFGSTIGAFGACYAIRSSLIEKIPPNTLMEDFFLSMNSLSKGFKNISEINALAFEDLPDTINEEFKRKRRISAGNFQNLSRFKHLLFSKVGFPFFSHKILRWFGPFFILFLGISSLSLAFISGFYSFYYYSLLLGLLILLIAFTDYVMMSFNIHVNLFRLIRYFLTMNLALFLGFIDYIKGIKSNIWQPTKRQ